MGVHIEAQHEAEYNQVKAREKQQDSIEKLEAIIPVVADTQQVLNNVDLEQVSNDNTVIKDVVVRNLEEQTDIDEISTTIESLSKKVNNINKKLNTMNKSLNEMKDTLNKLNEKLGDK